MKTRREKMKQGIELMNRFWYKGNKPSITGMYRVSDEIEGDSNVCAVCLAIDDVPYNFGDEIEPTMYDGDCDECNGESLLYCGGDEE
jgi:hypothetical protein